MQQLPNFDKELSDERDDAEASGEVSDFILFHFFQSLFSETIIPCKMDSLTCLKNVGVEICWCCRCR